MASPPDTYREPLHALLDTVDHAARLQAKIDRLIAARQDAIDQLVAAAARVNPLELDDAAELYQRLHEGAVVGRLRVLAAAGWHPQRILRDLDRRRREQATGWVPEGIPCVYLLLDDTRVVYVGRTVHLSARLRSHRREKAGQWDSYRAFRCRSDDDADDLEATLIQQHLPPLNKRIEQRRAS